MTPTIALPQARPPPPVSPWKPRRIAAALAGSALVHGLWLSISLVLAARTMLPDAPAEGSVAMVFESPAAPVSEPPNQAPAHEQEAKPSPTPAPQPDLAEKPPASEPQPRSELPSQALPEPPPPPSTEHPVQRPAEPPSRRPPPRARPASSPTHRPATEAAPSRPAHIRATPDLPTPGLPAPDLPIGASASSSQAVASSGTQASATQTSVAWRQALAAWLLAHKTYPDAARQRGIEGTVGLRFTLDRTGQVIDLAVIRRSGSPVLDAGAEAMLRNARLPPPDPPQDRITISVQLRYALTDR